MSPAYPSRQCLPPGWPRLRSKVPGLPPADALLKALDPGPQLDFPGPGRARLMEHAEIGRGDRVGVQHAVGLIRRLDPAGIADRAVDDEVGDMDALRRQLARHALGEAAQRELAHRERRRQRVTLDAR